MTNVILLNLGYFSVFLALADVVSPKRLTYFIWNRNNLDKLRKSREVTTGNLDSILTLDMAGKLTR